MTVRRTAGVNWRPLSGRGLTGTVVVECVPVSDRAGDGGIDGTRDDAIVPFIVGELVVGSNRPIGAGLDVATGATLDG